MSVFKKSLLVEYGRFTGNDSSFKWNRLNNDIKGRPSIKDYDVSNFVPPYNQAVYTFNRNKTCRYTFLPLWGGDGGRSSEFTMNVLLLARGVCNGRFELYSRGPIVRLSLLLGVHA